MSIHYSGVTIIKLSIFGKEIMFIHYSFISGVTVTQLLIFGEKTLSIHYSGVTVIKLTNFEEEILSVHYSCITLINVTSVNFFHFQILKKSYFFIINKITINTKCVSDICLQFLKAK